MFGPNLVLLCSTCVLYIVLQSYDIAEEQLGLSINGNTNLCCRGFILAQFKVLQPIQLILDIPDRSYSRYAMLFPVCEVET